MAQHPVDIHVGHRLRSRRTLLGISQESLGESVGVTFQQIQKYEKGLNRIGSSRLYEFARILNITVSYFFEGINDYQPENTFALAEDHLPFEYEKLGNKEILTLVRAYNDIADPLVRKRVLSLIKSLSSNQNNHDAKEEAESSSKEALKSA